MKNYFSILYAEIMSKLALFIKKKMLIYKRMFESARYLWRILICIFWFIWFFLYIRNLCL